MKKWCYLLLIFVVQLSTAQNALPIFLEGTWKMENAEIYEHWDQLNNQTLKGFSYAVNNENVQVTEYLEITQNKKRVSYAATVLNQNNGKTIIFTQTAHKEAFVFENKKHDFPQKIVYQKLNDQEVLVEVSTNNSKKYSYKLIKHSPITTSGNNKNYNSTLAEKLGADDYGMKTYFFVILRSGSNKTATKELVAESFKGHLNNINQLVADGKMLVAGPFGSNQNNYRGLFILNNVSTLDEAKHLLLTDPAIQNNLLDYEIYTWYGSAALPEYLPFADQIWKVKP